MGDYSIWEHVTEINWLYVIGAILLLSLFIIMINKVIEGVSSILNKRFGLKIITSRSQDHELLMSTCESLEKLSDRQKKDAEESNEHDIEIKNELQNVINNMQESLSEIRNNQKETNASIVTLTEQFTVMEENTNRRFQEEEDARRQQKRAELKDKISQSYRYYHEKQKINDIEFETLDDLIKAYESCGGNNSFVHSVVQKEMYTWEKIQRK